MSVRTSIFLHSDFPFIKGQLSIIQPSISCIFVVLEEPYAVLDNIVDDGNFW